MTHDRTVSMTGRGLPMVVDTAGRVRRDGMGLRVTGLTILVSAIAGAAISLGTIPQMVVVITVSVVAIFGIAGQIRLSWLLLWVAASGIAYPFLRTSSTHTPLTFDRVWMVIGLVGVLVGIAKPISSGTVRRLTLSLAVLAVVYSCRALATSALPFASRLSAMEALLLPLTGYLLAFRYARTPDTFRRLAGAMAVGGTLIALVGIAEEVLGFELASRTGGTARFDSELGRVRISGPYPVPEVFGVVLVICLAATLYWSLRNRGRRRHIGVSMVGLQCVAIGVTYFRTFWLTMILTVIIVLGIRHGRVGRSGAVILAAALALGLAYTQVGSSATISNRLDNTANVYGRFDIYRVAGELFLRHPYAGVGVSQFVTARSTLPATEIVTRTEGVLYPHNSYTGDLAEQGLIGFVPLVATTMAALALIRRLRRIKRSPEDELFAATLLAVALGYIISSLTLDMLTYAPSNCFIAILLGAGAGRLESVVSARKMRVPQAELDAP